MSYPTPEESTRHFILDSMPTQMIMASYIIIEINYCLIFSLLVSGAQLEPISFAITSDSDQFVSFTLTCTSNRGPIEEMRWERDGVPVPGSSIYPDLTDPEMATYTNTLRVMNRQPSVYTCTATDGGTLSLSQSFTVEGKSAGAKVALIVYDSL